MIHRILNQFSRKGRITRGEYLISFIFYFATNFILYHIVHYEPTPDYIKKNIHFVTLPLLIFIILKGARRCHDRGRSGLFQFIPGYVFIMLTGVGDYGVNKYGPNPTGEGNNY